MIKPVQDFLIRNFNEKCLISKNKQSSISLMFSKRTLFCWKYIKPILSLIISGYIYIQCMSSSELLLQYPLSSLANVLLSNPAPKIIICALMLPMDTATIQPPSPAALRSYRRNTSGSREGNTGSVERE